MKIKKIKTVKNQKIGLKMTVKNYKEKSDLFCKGLTIIEKRKKLKHRHCEEIRRVFVQANVAIF